MITFIKGKVIVCQPTSLILETGGIGYYINISLNTYSKINEMSELMILTHQIIKEDGHYLYGFAEENERTLFVQLLSVNGVGANTARVILSSLDPSSVRMAILTGDDTVFRKVKGVGPKTAQRIIIDLKDKISKESGNEQIISKSVGFKGKNEALSALLALGFIRTQVEQVIRTISDQEAENSNIEELIKLCLKKLS
ncbi:MAG: Holliday junction branch migration protein RuvA [Saprospiraceae bacterium]